MPFAVIKIDSFKTQEPGYVNFKSSDQKSWNCNKPELVEHLTVGERYYIEYNETEPKPGYKYGSKYINKARFWKPEDGPNTWPDKEPYTGGGQSRSSYGGSKVSKDYDPEVGKRQTAANVAGNIVSKMIEGLPEEGRIDAFAMFFPTVADIVFKWVDSKGSKSDVPAEGSGAAGAEEFGF